MEIMTIHLVLKTLPLEPVDGRSLDCLVVPVGDERFGMDGKPGSASETSLLEFGLAAAVCFAPFVAVASMRTSSEVVPHANE